MTTTPTPTPRPTRIVDGISAPGPLDALVVLTYLARL